MQHDYMPHDIVAAIHAPLWKGVMLATVGLGTTVYAGVQKVMATANPLIASSPVGVATLDLSGAVGTALTIAGTVWTWWLYQQGKKESARLARQAEAARVKLSIERDEADGRRDAWLKDRLAEIHVAVERQAAHLSKQDAELAAVKQAVTPADKPSEPA